MRIVALLLFGLVVSPLAVGEIISQAGDSYRIQRSKAVELADRRSPDAEAALKLLLEEKPDDDIVLFRLGIEISIRGRTLKPGSRERREAMLQSRTYLEQAAKAGSTDPLITTVLAAIKPDGSEAIVGQVLANPTADRELHIAEEAFGRREFDLAIEHYRAALALEPASYLVLLHLGDAYFASGRPAEALDWFGKAAAVNPDRETAHRYAGDALMQLRRKDEALEHYLSAVIAEPYNGYPWRGLQSGCKGMLLKPWLQAAKTPVAQIKDSKPKTEILLPEKYTVYQLSYALARAKWLDENRSQRFPSGTPYRQTLDEEVSALTALLQIHTELKKAKAVDDKNPELLAESSAALDELAEISSAGLLEAHILFFRAKDDIAKDYADYRAKNREKLRSYLVKFYLHLP